MNCPTCGQKYIWRPLKPIEGQGGMWWCDDYGDDRPARSSVPSRYEDAPAEPK